MRDELRQVAEPNVTALFLRNESGSSRMRLLRLLYMIAIGAVVALVLWMDGRGETAGGDAGPGRAARDAVEVTGLGVADAMPSGRPDGRKGCDPGLLPDSPATFA